MTILKASIATVLMMAGSWLSSGIAKAEGPSFDCHAASTRIEYAICGNPSLSSLDLHLGQAFTAALASAANPAELRGSQRDWLKERNRCPTDTGCLEAAFSARISQLTAGAAPAASQQRSSITTVPGLKVGNTVVTGSRAGMVSRVEAVDGPGTAQAHIDFQETDETAAMYCTEYVGQNPPTPKCIADRIAESGGRVGHYRGNCRTGEFTTWPGTNLRFLGRNAHVSTDYITNDTPFLIQDLGTGRVLEGYSASGYFVALEIYSGLCPGSLEAARPVDRPAEFIECSDPGLVDQVTRVATGSGYAHLMNARIVDFSGIRQVRVTPTERVCIATVLLSFGGEHLLTYRQYLRNGKQFIETSFN